MYFVLPVILLYKHISNYYFEVNKSMFLEKFISVNMKRYFYNCSIILFNFGNVPLVVHRKGDYRTGVTFTPIWTPF